MRAILVIVVVLWLVTSPSSADALNLGLAEAVQASYVDIAVPGYSIPSFVDWNSDGVCDLIVGEGSGTLPAKVRVYINYGSAAAPFFVTHFYVQSNGSDLVVVGGGCQGACPRVVYWDADGNKDLLVGQADGTLKLFTNIGTDTAPTFDGGTLLQVGIPGSQVDITVAARANPVVVDWDSDGRRDLVVGALDGKIHIFLNVGTDTEPLYLTEALAQSQGADLVVPTARSSPAVLDIDGDGMKDLLSGNTEGNLVFYSNLGTNTAPYFGDYELIESDGVPIDLAGTPRSRPSVCYWSTDDDILDVLIGSVDGMVRLYQGVAQTGDLNCDGFVNAYDIDPFICAVSPNCDFESIYGCQRMLGDCNGDGDVNAYDIDSFIALVGR
ncbi:MAG: VCBS repeat-containing protein [Planctomycetota bacterium]